MKRCDIRRKLAEEFETAAPLYAESAIRLASSGKSGVDFVRPRDQTIEARIGRKLHSGVSTSTSLPIGASDGKTIGVPVSDPAKINRPRVYEFNGHAAKPPLSAAPQLGDSTPPTV